MEINKSNLMIYWIFETNGASYEAEEIYTHIIVSKDEERVKKTFSNLIMKCYSQHKKAIKEQTYVEDKVHNFKDFVASYFMWYKYPEWNEFLNKKHFIEDELIHLDLNYTKIKGF